MISYDHKKAVITSMKTTVRGSIRKTLLATDEGGYKIKTYCFEVYPFSVDATEVDNPEEAIRELVEWGNILYRHRGASPLSHIVSSLETTGCYTCGL